MKSILENDDSIYRHFQLQVHLWLMLKDKYWMLKRTRDQNATNEDFLIDWSHSILWRMSLFLGLKNWESIQKTSFFEYSLRTIECLSISFSVTFHEKRFWSSEGGDYLNGRGPFSLKTVFNSEHFNGKSEKEKKYSDGWGFIPKWHIPQFLKSTKTEEWWRYTDRKFEKRKWGSTRNPKREVSGSQ